MVSVGRGIHSVQFKHNAALLRRRVQEQEKLLVVLAVSLAKDDDVFEVLSSRRKKPRLKKNPKLLICSIVLVPWLVGLTG